MNQIEKLLAELCPEGVEFRKLEDIFDLRNGYTPSKSNSSFWENGTVPWFRMEDIRASGRILDDSIQHVNKSAIKGGKLFPANSIIVATSATIGEHALITVPHLTNQRFTCLSLKPEFEELFDIKFLFYYAFVLNQWCCNNTNSSSFASVDMQGFRKFKFPIPPIAIQNKIVTILDKFVELQAELQAELQKRKLQYEYYRNALLTFPDSGDYTIFPCLQQLLDKYCPEGVEFKALGEIGVFIRGSGIQKSDFVEKGVGCIHYGQIHTYYGVWADKTLSFISACFAKRLRKALKGDLVIATTSEDNTNVAKAIAWLGENSVAVSTDACIFRHDLDCKYISYFFQTDFFQLQKSKNITGTKVRRISIDNLKKIKIPIPPLSIQQKIVAILDKFDALVNNLTSGLPAEIKARRTQYEYYRNQLLSFKEKSLSHSN